MTVYSGPVFDMAVNQFAVIADHLSIPHDERDRLLLPKRALTISCPIHRDDGSIAVFEGYRVQHLLTLGHTKVCTRFVLCVAICDVAELARRVMKELAINLGNATAVVQGFGNVGSYAALGLHQFGLKVIAVSDHTGALYDKAGLDIPALMRHAGDHGSIAGFSNELHFDLAQL